MPLDQSKPYPKRARLLDRSSYKGVRACLVTINTYKRKKFFQKTNIVNSLVNYLDQVSQKVGIDIIVYCFMPDHLHLVLVGRDESSSVLRFVNSYKQISGYHFKKSFQTRLWATSFHDRVLRAQEDIKSVGRYVLLNPVRAGIVVDALAYPYVGSFVYDVKELLETDSLARFEYAQA